MVLHKPVTLPESPDPPYFEGDSPGCIVASFAHGGGTAIALTVS
jgi:hypothetical protein